MPLISDIADDELELNSLTDCTLYLRGSCLYGQACCFRHHDRVREDTHHCPGWMQGMCVDMDCCKKHDISLQRQAPQKDTCSDDFDSKTSTYVGALCFAYMRGQCSQGASCDFIHHHKYDPPAASYSRSLPPSLPPPPSLPLPSVLIPAVKRMEVIRPICFEFQNGACVRGDACSLQHTTAQPRTSALVINGAICFDFLKGVCNRGASCILLHDASIRPRYRRMQEQQQLEQQQHQKEGQLENLSDEDDDSDEEEEEDEVDRAFFLSATQQRSDDSFFLQHNEEGHEE
jgi:hypothetical protein